MTLLDLHVELTVTNELLKRIADALDRAVPVITPPDHTKHPLIGLADISRMTPDHAARLEAERATMNPVRASDRVRFSNKPDQQSGQPHTDSAQASATGQWDHEDPLDTLDELDNQWNNYPGVPG